MKSKQHYNINQILKNITYFFKNPISFIKKRNELRMSVAHYWKLSKHKEKRYNKTISIGEILNPKIGGKHE